MQSVVIEHDGRVVGVAVRVRGGFLFLSSEREFKALEAKLFRRIQTLKDQVAEIARSNAPPLEERAIISPGPASAIETGRANVVQLRPRAAWTRDPHPEPPDAA
jgi:hypothetical protein